MISKNSLSKLRTRLCLVSYVPWRQLSFFFTTPWICFRNSKSIHDKPQLSYILGRETISLFFVIINILFSTKALQSTSVKKVSSTTYAFGILIEFPPLPPRELSRFILLLHFSENCSKFHNGIEYTGIWAYMRMSYMVDICWIRIHARCFAGLKSANRCSITLYQDLNYVKLWLKH